MNVALLTLICALVQPPLPRQPLGPILQYGRLVREERQDSRRIVYNRPCFIRAGTVLVTETSNAPRRLFLSAVGEQCYEHVAIAIELDGKLVIFEADDRENVRFVDVQSFIDYYINVGDKIWIINPEKGFSDEESQTLTNFALAHERDRYSSHKELVRAVTTSPFLKKTALPDPAREDFVRSWFCSKLVVACLHQVKQATRFRAESTTPGDVMRHGLGKSWLKPEEWQPAKFETPKYLTPTPPAPQRRLGGGGGFFYWFIPSNIEVKQQ